MANPMHFRKRQLMEYQTEASLSHPNGQQQYGMSEYNYNYIHQPQIIYEYPPSPASMGSEKSTPTKYDNTPPDPNSPKTSEYTPEQMQILAKNTAALLEMENLSPKSSKDAKKLTEIARSLTALENLSYNPNTHPDGNDVKFTYDTSTLIHFAYNLKETIEDYIKQEITNASANKSSLSTLIFARLNQLRVNALLKPKKCVEQLNFKHSYCAPSVEEPMDIEPEDLSIKRAVQNNHSNCQELTADDSYDEPALVIDEDYMEISSDDDEIQNIPAEKPKPKPQPKKEHTRQGLQQIVARISGIFSFINRTQAQMESLMRQGINVYEKATHSSEKSKKKAKKAKKEAKKEAQKLLTTTKTAASTKSSTSASTAPSTSSSSKTFSSKDSTYNKNQLKFLKTFTDIITPPPMPLPLANRPLGAYKARPWTNGLGDEFKYNTNYPIPCPYDDTRLIIGKNGTRITKTEWAIVDWKQTPPAITRKILLFLFNRDILGTHSLTGRPSPAFLDRENPQKKPLDANIISDLVDLVTSRTIATAKEVRMAITTKCADEAKMYKVREMKQFKITGNLRVRPY